MKIITHIIRFIVGALFIFSGFVKLVDPIGSQYKFQEYFSEGVLDMEFLIPFALPLAILLIIGEIVLGVALLVGWLPKLTLWKLLGLILVFLFLTWYSAYYNKVTDCGCFGDFMKLTPWQSFYKDVVLTIMIIFLLFQTKHIKPILSGKTPALVTILSFFASMFLAYHVLTHLPLIDFRPYAIGNNISEGMEYKGDGEIPPVHDFSLESAEADLTEELLSKEKVMLVIVYNIDKADENGFSPIKKMTDEAIIKGYTVYGVSASFEDDLVIAQNKHDLPFEFLFCDETTLKTIVRGNPGVVILNKGTVTGKWNYTDVADIEL
ncbi:BT_3928 family protein [Tenacibaculum aquimarinum]|uniref:BT_3928 family protein n=1 Tax=Tenacibaculum aquimarinum TaxID=2910675 RepID=UPI001F0B2C82|nr:BT_3928 family protein [Tenacibaculum aquimarinum]MCH3884424.1 DoxX family protein [Tenacibaculum aquimarinum]